MSDNAKPRPGVELGCLDGAKAPPGLGPDLCTLADLPDRALHDFGRVIDVTIGDPVPAAADRVIEAFAKEHGVEPSQVARAASAVRALYRAAARVDLSVEGLKADFRALTGDRAEALISLVVSGYEPSRVRIQRELLAKTVAAHGKVLTDVEWRIETVNESSFGRGFRLPLITITLRYQEDGKSSSVTLHALPTVLKKLKDVLAKLVV